MVQLMMSRVKINITSHVKAHKINNVAHYGNIIIQVKISDYLTYCTASNKDHVRKT